jgi:hypothetical protein
LKYFKIYQSEGGEILPGVVRASSVLEARKVATRELAREDPYYSNWSLPATIQDLGFDSASVYETSKEAFDSFLSIARGLRASSEYPEGLYLGTNFISLPPEYIDYFKSMGETIEPLGDILSNPDLDLPKDSIVLGPRGSTGLSSEALSKLLEERGGG